MSKTAIALLSAMLLCGCVSLGPKTVVNDRLDYIQEISESWKKQMLFNIVKMRYLDPPTFLDVTSLISQYGIEQQVNASANTGFTWPQSPTSPYGFGGMLGGHQRYVDKPTISYAPLTGQKFTKNLLTPIPPAAVINMIQSGWPIDRIFSFTVKSINGVRNTSRMQASLNEGADFERLLKAMRSIQSAGASDIRVEKAGERDAVIFVISDEARKEEFRENAGAVREILGLKPGVKKYTVVEGKIPGNDEEIALATRSMLEIMLEIAAAIEVPPQHVKEGRTMPTPSVAASENLFSVKIRSSRQKPSDIFTAIQYRDYWFWVDDKDIASKRNFTLMMIFLSLTETDQKLAAPLLTISN